MRTTLREEPEEEETDDVPGEKITYKDLFEEG